MTPASVEGLSVRAWAKADLNAILSIQSEAPGASAWNRESYENIFERGEPDYGCVAEAGNGVIGFACFRVIVPDAELMNIAVAESMRRRGVGRALIEYIYVVLARRGADRFYLEVRSSNAPAIALYHRLGFERMGLRKDYYSEPREDALTFRASILKGSPSGPVDVSITTPTDTPEWT